ncbi:MAG: radical SAM protein [Planctomycetes bacterium]|nr:radical SAM protein [Planctomycetota bacterium]
MKRIDNPPNPYVAEHRQWLEPPPPARVEVYEERSRSILAQNESPDLPFRWSCNPYRGCQHGCTYCYARTSHEYLGLGAGTDFETKLVVKVNAPELLAKTLSGRGWSGEHVNFSGVTDCYQPLEAVYRLTQRCLAVCLEHRNPAVVVTKAFLVARDAELLAELNRVAGAQVWVSIPIADPTISRALEPQAPPPQRRFEAIARLSAAGVPVGVMVAPVIPGLSDRDIPAILRQAREAGAARATCIPLRLPGSVEQVFLSRLRRDLPLHANRVEQRLRDVRGGRLDEQRFGRRFRGQGVYWESVKRLFEVWRDRLGFESAGGGGAMEKPGHACGARTDARQSRQLTLFD